MAIFQAVKPKPRTLVITFFIKRANNIFYTNVIKVLQSSNIGLHARKEKRLYKHDSTDRSFVYYFIMNLLLFVVVVLPAFTNTHAMARIRQVIIILQRCYSCPKKQCLRLLTETSYGLTMKEWYLQFVTVNIRHCPLEKFMYNNYFLSYHVFDVRKTSSAPFKDTTLEENFIQAPINCCLFHSRCF